MPARVSRTVTMGTGEDQGTAPAGGKHLLVDLYGGKRLDDVGHVERTLKRCVEAAGATLLHLHLQPLEPTGGITGVAVLAESHISIHSWPAEGYAALDVFMSGSADPQRTVSVLKEAFEAGEVVVRTHRRGKASKSRSNAPARKVRAA
ncbi:S-adenosylmethionine decarboxylase [Hyphomicrobium nitrativorans NL23]|uniref:S-adenosylmethionine decarboxylase n=1 Tax=Hyphomicrobium nitrativorans NL23 TaxID=1029756 RepID=V5SGV0_9HYPH|nr:S-adenosylmethionine decarboxylase [Hyphomicrobium nitrativorans NL23]